MTKYHRGFTLIELSVVLVIIGLLTGSILIGRDLIAASAVTATISQLQKFQAATIAFRDKYAALPGDIPARLVTAYNFTAAPTRAGTAGRGDGNGYVEAYLYDISWQQDAGQGGEDVWFWEDLSTNSGLIEGGFNLATDGVFNPANIYAQSAAGVVTLAYVMPPAKLGGGNFIYVYSWNNINYFALSANYQLDFNNILHSLPGLTVNQAYSIDSKMDDGTPQGGNITAQYINYDVGGGTLAPVWAQGCVGGNCNTSGNVTASAPSGTAATAGSNLTCYDNGNTANATQQYSLAQRGGRGVNCALSFRFQ